MNTIKRELSEEKLIMFAPEYYYDSGEYLYVTCGSVNDRIYEQKDWGNTKERWYKKGNNHFCCYKRAVDGEWILVDDNVLFTGEFEDVMKLSVVKVGDRKLMWFSGLKDNQWDIYVAHSSQDIEKVTFANVTESEIHRFLPCVLYDGVYKMWYASRNIDHRRIFYAESNDGVRWTGNRMVLDIGERFSGDNYAVDCPNVVKHQQGYIMFYGGGSSRGIHLAISKDGSNWERKGLIIPRGTESEESYNYSFYPALAIRGNSLDSVKDLTLYYAGEDIDHNWRILSMTDNFLDNIYEPKKISCGDICYISERLNQIPEEFFKNQTDCNCKEDYYEDEEIVQLRPSTVPVFSFKNKGLVVKVMTDRVKAENEYKARLMLQNRLDVVEASIFYLEEKVLLVMPYIEGARSCDELSIKDKDRFYYIYLQMLSDCADVLRINASESFVPKVQYTGQTPNLLCQWCEEIGEKYRSIKLVSGVSGKKYNISEQMRRAKELISKVPACCALFSGDINLHNVLCIGSNVKYLDFEYWGYYDVDYIVAKIIGSLYKHCDCLEAINYYISENEIVIRYRIEDGLKHLFTMELYKEILTDIKVNFERIKAYILSKLFFRFKVAYDNLQMNTAESNTGWLINETIGDRGHKHLIDSALGYIDDGKIRGAISELTRVIGVLDLFE